jgi:transmembrane sensor
MSPKRATNEHTPSPQGSPKEAAAYWDARLRNPDCSAEERAQYEAWRAASPDNAEAFERLQDLLEAMRGARSRPMLRAIHDAAREKRRRRFFRYGLAAAAAIVVAIVGLNLATTNGADPLHAPPATQIAANISVQVYQTAVGEQRTVTLQDGSTVTLNTNSRLEERFSPNRRDVTLVAGQALFQVAHDASRPFIVAAGDRQVTAIGTEFDVRLSGERVRVVLVEGRVAVERRPQGELLDGLLAQRRELTAGQQYQSTEAIFTPVSVNATDVNNATLWREGRVAFDDAPLPDAIAEMNRYSTGSLIVTDPTMAELRVNGVFRTDSQQAFINALEEYYPVEAREQPGGDTLLVWRQ